VDPGKVTMQFDLSEDAEQRKEEASSPDSITVEKIDDPDSGTPPAEESAAGANAADAHKEPEDDPLPLLASSEIEVNGAEISVEVKDASGRVLKTFGIRLNPDTRQVRITLDVKK
jgi:hypothetical protein